MKKTFCIFIQLLIFNFKMKKNEKIRVLNSIINNNGMCNLDCLICPLFKKCKYYEGILNDDFTLSIAKQEINKYKIKLF